MPCMHSKAANHDWRQLTAALAAILQPFGLDIVHPFAVQLYNAQAPALDHQLPTFDCPGTITSNASSQTHSKGPSRRRSTLAVVIGNTAAIWRPFLQEQAWQCYRQQQQPQQQQPQPQQHQHRHQEQQQQQQPKEAHIGKMCLSQDPLDAYVQHHVMSALQQVCCSSSSSKVEGISSAWITSHPEHTTTPKKDSEARDSSNPGLPQSTLPAPPASDASQGSSSSPCIATTAGSIAHDVCFSHETGPRFVNMLRAAQLSGLAYYSTTTHLCLHPTYGPWFALRAVAVLDCDGPDPDSIVQLPCPNPELEAEAAERMQASTAIEPPCQHAFDLLLHMSAVISVAGTGAGKCSTCRSISLRLLHIDDVGMQGALPEHLETLRGFRSWQQHWREWADLRALGGRYTDPRYAYSADQLEYHYTKSKAVLTKAITDVLQQQQQQQM